MTLIQFKSLRFFSLSFEYSRIRDFESRLLILSSRGKRTTFFSFVAHQLFASIIHHDSTDRNDLRYEKQHGEQTSYSHRCIYHIEASTLSANTLNSAECSDK